MIAGCLVIFTFLVLGKENVDAEDIPLSGKSTNQTGTYGSMTSDKAIDGRLFEGNQEANCAHPANPTGAAAEWWVDLGQVYKIHSITVYNTGDSGGSRRLQYFAFNVYQPGSTQATESYDNSQQVAPNDFLNRTCNQHTYGQYVQFIRTGGSDIHLVTICEIKITGQVYKACSVGCASTAAGSETCDTTGTCTAGCRTWWIGTNCDMNIAIPQPPGIDISHSEITMSSVKLSIPEAQGIPPAANSYYGYEVSYGATTKDVKHTGTGSVDVILTGLTHNTDYTMTVKPYRQWSAGQRDRGGTYAAVNFRTLCIAPEATISGVTMGDGTVVGMKTINVEYTVESGCDQLTKLILQYRTSGTTEWKNITLVASSTAGVQTISVESGEYMIRMVATNDQNTERVSAESSTTAATAAPTTGGLPPKTIIIIAVCCTLGILIIVVIVVVVILCKRRQPKKEPLHDTDHESAMVNGIQNASFAADLHPAIKPEQSELQSAAHSRIATPIPTEDDERNEETELKTLAAADQDASGSNSYSDEENPYANSVIPVSSFESYANGKKANMSEFVKEYNALPPIDHSRYKIAVTDDNKRKNRFLNIYPYDLTRVTLDKENDDYVNATFITGYNNEERVYIATQGPVYHTMQDFWLMVWQYEVNRVVMVANCVEDGKKKCDQYWPKEMGEVMDHDEFKVTVEAIEECADHTVRIMTLQRGTECRTVRQFHFTSWRDKGRPMYGSITLLNFHKKVRAVDDTASGPLLVHCSAGVGRTGTFIALDILLQQAHLDRAVDIFGCVQRMRLERMLMVQTKDQYEFLHDCLLEHIQLGNTAYTCTQLAKTLEQLSVEEDDGASELQKQFNLLTEIKKPSTDQYLEGLTEKNKHKNRDLSVIPAETDRPYLATQHGASDYINAVYVDSFKKHSYYVVTQMPLSHTQVDLWRLVFDHQLNTVVMLNELPESDESCEQYWPGPESSQVYGPIKVTNMAETTISNGIIMREFVLSLACDENNDGGKPTLTRTSSRTHLVRHYQLVGWPDAELLPQDREVLLDLLEELNKWQQQRKMTDRLGQVVIHCIDGAVRSGLFCAVSHTLDRMKIEQEVDAFLAVRYVARRRSQFIGSVEEYKFLYEMALQYMTRHDTYANFQ